MHVKRKCMLPARCAICGKIMKMHCIIVKLLKICRLIMQIAFSGDSKERMFLMNQSQLDTIYIWLHAKSHLKFKISALFFKLSDSTALKNKGVNGF